VRETPGPGRGTGSGVVASTAGGPHRPLIRPEHTSSVHPDGRRPPPQAVSDAGGRSTSHTGGPSARWLSPASAWRCSAAKPRRCHRWRHRGRKTPPEPRRVRPDERRDRITADAGHTAANQPIAPRSASRLWCGWNM